MSFLINATNLLANAAPANGTSMTRTLTFFGIVLVFFYLILWRPEQKRRKKMQNTRNTLKAGDRVTAIGFVGTVDEIKEQTVILKSVDGTRFEVLKQAITDVAPATQEVKEKEPVLEEVTSK